MTIGAGWAEGAWTDAGWATGAWAPPTTTKTIGGTSQIGAVTSTGGLTVGRKIGGTSQIGAITSTGGLTVQPQRTIGGTSQIGAFTSSGGITVGATTTVRGRRRRTRTYQTPAPTPEALEESYAELVEAAPAQVVRRLVGAYILRGDAPVTGAPKRGAVDWSALAADTERVVELMDAYVEYVEDEEITTVLLLGEF